MEKGVGKSRLSYLFNKLVAKSQLSLNFKQTFTYMVLLISLKVALQGYTISHRDFSGRRVSVNSVTP